MTVSPFLNFFTLALPPRGRFRLRRGYARLRYGGDALPAGLLGGVTPQLHLAELPMCEQRLRAKESNGAHVEAKTLWRVNVSLTTVGEVLVPRITRTAFG